MIDSYTFPERCCVHFVYLSTHLSISGITADTAPANSRVTASTSATLASVGAALMSTLAVVIDQLIGFYFIIEDLVEGYTFSMLAELSRLGAARVMPAKERRRTLMICMLGLMRGQYWKGGFDNGNETMLASSFQ